MKYLTLFLLAGILGCGCYPAFTEKSPYIVEGVRKSYANVCVYWNETNDKLYALCYTFNVGDTIYLTKFPPKEKID